MTTKSLCAGRSAILTITVILFLSWVAAADAAISLPGWQEDFDGYMSFPQYKPAGDPVNLGVPLTSEGADSALWLAARFEKADSPTSEIGKDVGVQKRGGGGNSTPVGRAGDDAGLVLRLDLTGYINVTVDFDWRTFQAETTDRFVVAYYTGNQPGLLGLPNGVYDWFNDAGLGQGDMSATNSDGGAGNTWYEANWTELLRASYSNTFTHEHFSLTGFGDAILYLAFWLDNGDKDFGKFDNVVVMADEKPIGGGSPVPEPSQWLVFSLTMVVGGALLRQTLFKSDSGTAFDS